VQQMRIKTNTSYAIETFATTGNSSYNIDENNNNLYSLKIINKNNNIKFKTDIAQKVFNYIKTTHGSLPFCSRWLYNKFGNNYKIAINELIKNDIINTYPPISDIKTSYSSQLEHTIYVHDYGKEILSHFYDY
jgi:methionyl aminopeptidase